MSPPLPTLDTPRLRLRPFTLADSATVERLAGAIEVASMLVNMPHPYPPGLAAEWIGRHADLAARGEFFMWAIEHKDGGELMGSFTLGVKGAHRRGHLGYWLGVPYWNRGYATEAAGPVLDVAFRDLSLHRVQALVFPRNLASCRVLEKVGFRAEGMLRGYLLKGEVFGDAIMYALLHPEFEEARRFAQSGSCWRGPSAVGSDMPRFRRSNAAKHRRLPLPPPEGRSRRFLASGRCHGVTAGRSPVTGCGDAALPQRQGLN
ncbi:MAG: GNAT family N-acetyltransferase, partial [Chloroflexi bacterium]|nr:GNAT family N-acetyltransferase [Chloroflexota bacterium]